jgi:AraC family transcriptional regulator of adaptative response/methylated-DNA-[protein]-cysteine methyltransferase
LNLTTTGTDFQNQVWQAITKIPTGTTATYQQLAQQLGKPKAYRAVANALARNNIAYFIPCHRITRANGSLGGYKWGIEIKSLLLDFEKKFNTSAHIECLV